MIFIYGSYAHAQNEVALVVSKRATIGPNGRREYIRWTFNLRGFLQADNQSALMTAITALEAAYATDGYNAGLYLDDGITATPHVLSTSTALGGVRVVEPPSYPNGEGAEGGTFRTYAITLEADYYDNLGTLLQFDEAIGFIGTGGPRYVFQETLEGDPQKQIAAQRTTYKATQSGSARGYIMPAAPPPIWPSAELGDQRRVVPRVSSGSPPIYSLEWSYVFESTQSLSGNPNAI